VSTGVYHPNEECEVGDLDNPKEMMKKCVADVCQPGNCLQCAGYVLYSSATNLVLTIGTGVFGFTLDPLVGEFVLTHDNIKIPDTGKIYSFNEGNYALWDKPVQEYMDSLKVPEKWGGKPYSVRLRASPQPLFCFIGRRFKSRCSACIDMLLWKLTMYVLHVGGWQGCAD
jgi:fructose-1,6-bisphosphatase I